MAGGEAFRVGTEESVARIVLSTSCVNISADSISRRQAAFVLDKWHPISSTHRPRDDPRQHAPSRRAAADCFVFE